MMQRPRAAHLPAIRSSVRRLQATHSARRRLLSALISVLAALVGGAIGASADEGGVSFWVPGTFGALAAAPLPQGYSLAEVYYHSPVNGGGDIAISRQVPIAGVLTKVPLDLDLHVSVDADLVLSAPSYVFASPILGGQASIGVIIPYGRNRVSVDQTLIGPRGIIPFAFGGPMTDAVTGVGDLEPQASLRWNFGVHNFMTYLTGDVPVGRYSPTALANIGYGHGAIDGGSGYTYFDHKTGQEFSAALGFTYNFINPSTEYQNGVDMHLDWSLSKFFAEKLQAGMAGYAYDQVSCDSGLGDKVGCFESRVLGVGPQLGYVIPLGGLQGYLNIKAYKDFDWDHRPHGWSGWITFVLSNSPTDPQHTPTHR
jgi:hypothetical protein